ncbi:sulfoxide reductase heme-binding subunit YedZ [Nakamurella sp. UYEF19]|uniref:ferric reductase n=1 Tax=Nakamurella sp. UYEF19 TaxID=1756392 RepID=UPI00339753D4
MPARESARVAARAGIVAVSAAFCGVLTGFTWQHIEGNRMALWLVARAAGASALLLLTVATLAGLVLSHPRRAGLRGLSPTTRLRLHVSLTVFALVFTALHVVVLVLDPYAKVGWMGALVPMGAAYRPLPVTLGVISLWAGAAAGLSAALAGRLRIRWWRGLHRAAALSWVAAWVHAVLAGSDSGRWTTAYAAMGIAVLAAAWWRYAAGRPRPGSETSKPTVRAPLPSGTPIEGTSGKVVSR